MSKEKIQYEEGESGNMYFEVSDNCIVSYADFNHPLWSIAPRGWLPDSQSPETALVMDGEYYILNGDFREQYEDAFLEFGSDAAKIKAAVYDKYKDDNGSSWSTG